MRIAHVLSSINKSGSFYGVESHALSLALKQKARGYDLLMATSQRGYFTKACDQHGIATVIVPGLAPQAERGDRIDRETIENLISHFTSFDADLIHGHTSTAATQAFFAASRIKTPCVFTLHATDRFYMERLRHQGVPVIAVSKEHIEKLEQIGFRTEENLHFVPNGTKVMLPEITRRESRRPNLILVGNLSFVKGIDVAILAMAVLHQRYGQDCPTLNIYGDTSVSEITGYLRESVVAVGLTDFINFHGNHPDILRDCAASDILVMPSRTETGPLVVLEAMSRGMPVVASNVGLVADMIPDERYGRVIPINSIMALADAIESTISDIASGRFDPELSITRHRTLFSDAIMAERTERVYEKILKRAMAR